MKIIIRLVSKLNMQNIFFKLDFEFNVVCYTGYLDPQLTKPFKKR